MRTLKQALRFTAALALVAACCYTPARAQITDNESGFYYEPLKIRHTSAASVPQELNWAKGFYGGSFVTGFTDSVVFRQGAATAILVDTSAAYPLSYFRLPPGFEHRPASQGSRAQRTYGASGPILAPSGTDSSIVDTTDATPWIALRVQQDTLSNSFTATSTLDSALFGAQISYDGGLNWLSVNGTPTRAFYANPTGVSGTDGLAIPMLAVAEVSPGADVVEARCRCFPQLWENTGTAFIFERTLCAAPANALVRFIVKVTDGSGQWAVWLGRWRHPTNADLN